MISWFSPLGWVLGAEVNVHNYWWPILVTVLAGIVMSLIALYLNAIRDLGAGFILTRPGRGTASAYLQGPYGLAVRIQRTALISWAVGIFVLGLSYGSVMGDLDSFFSGSELLQEMLDPTDGFSMTE